MISEGIRKWCDLCCGDFVSKEDCDELREVADRIDSEMMALPKDRDGVPIHVGDTVWDVGDGMKFTVTSITLYADGAAKVDASCYGCDAHTSPTDFTHNRPDSLERIADDIELAEKWCDQNGEYGTGISSVGESTLHGWAERIRKLAKEDEHGN